jgi:hypothetical protein
MKRSSCFEEVIIVAGGCRARDTRQENQRLLVYCPGAMMRKRSMPDMQNYLQRCPPHQLPVLVKILRDYIRQHTHSMKWTLDISCLVWTANGRQHYKYLVQIDGPSSKDAFTTLGKVRRLLESADLCTQPPYRICFFAPV